MWYYFFLESEFKEIRLQLLSKMVERLVAPPSLMAFNRFFLHNYGHYQQTTCLDHGLTAILVADICTESEQFVLKAVYCLVQEDKALFVDFSSKKPSELFNSILEQVKEIGVGKGDAILHSIMNWVQVVQLCGLQDFVEKYSRVFKQLKEASNGMGAKCAGAWGLWLCMDGDGPHNSVEHKNILNLHCYCRTCS